MASMASSSSPASSSASASSAPSSTVPTHIGTLEDLFAPHVRSFNYMLESGLETAVQHLPVMQIDANAEKAIPSIRFWIKEVQIGYPSKNDDSNDSRLFPSECRELGISYTAPLLCTLQRQVGEDGPVETSTKRLGSVPIMVRSARCHLQHSSPADLLAHHEEHTEKGGYFVVNGNERVMRLLIVPRRHYVMAVERPTFMNRGNDYTKYAVQVRCVRPDQTSKTLTLHYLSSGDCTLRVSMRKQEFFIPVLLLLKAFTDASDRTVFDRLVQGNTKNAWLTDRVELMLRAHSHTGLRTRRAILEHLGANFRILTRPPDSVSNEQVGEDLLRDQIFVHCTGDTDARNNQRKFDLLVHMMHKLYALVQGTIKPDNPDALNCQEVLLPGHLYLMVLKEKLEELLTGVRAQIMLDTRLNPARVDLVKGRYFASVLDIQKDVGRAIHYFLVTGNLISTSGLDLMQTSGFTIVGEKLNYFRYLSHYRSVHRGQFFTTMKTTDVRKLLPESFGFFCPAHTPDGAPCGLLNHFTASTTVLTHPCAIAHERLVRVLADIGLMDQSAFPLLPHTYVPVILDGFVVGHVAPHASLRFVQQLRLLKVQGHPDVDRSLEIYAIHDGADKLFPSILLYTSPARVIRPVRYLGPSREHSWVEWIGSQEQITMEIAITDSDYRAGETTHQELAPTSMLSVVASMTPFSDFNQSPRNMYQCQMGKQTMGTPFHSFLHRVDNKVFRIQNPQSPVVRNDNYVRYGIDEYPLGTNAVVAVLAYTGYDMEDAMIINKMAYERGFKHGSVYKYKKLDLSEKRKRGEPIHHRFSNVLPETKETMQRRLQRQNAAAASSTSAQAANEKYLECGPNGELLATPMLDIDGLPRIGQRIQPGDPLYCYVDDTVKRAKVTAHKENEVAIVDDIRLLGDPDMTTSARGELQRVGLKLRFDRNPVIGDKFASRAGQKGVMSTLFPAQNMPFTESGMTPDIIINPHAFPSRMTIGMLIESMAGKAGCVQGVRQNSTPFQFSEDDRAVDFFGKQLLQSGYSYVGTEPMYSGITGQEVRADIFIGVVYYQRLRHMVSDKSQVRATGPINALTRQPIKGRKVHGGIRFGEMERDSLLGHGTAFLLHDRLMNCSDYHTGFVCTLCGSVLSPSVYHDASADNGGLASDSVFCRMCKTDRGCSTIAIPYVFMYLVNELAAMNIRITLNIK